MNLKRQGDSVVAVFGLTGDPFTIAHREICKQAMDRLPIEKLYVIPTIVDYHRSGKETWLNDGERVRCAESMLWSLGPNYLGKWEVDRHEIDLKYLASDFGARSDLQEEIVTQRRFLHTLLDFKCRIGVFKQVLLVLGTDSFMNLPLWYRWEDICSRISGIVVVDGRDGESAENPENIRDLVSVCPLPIDDEEILRVSASKVRKACKNCMPMVDYLTEVSAYDSGKVTLRDLGWI